MIKILFIAKYGHDLHYFSTIKKYIEARTDKIKADIVFNLPFFFLEFFTFTRLGALSKQELESVIIAEIKRKYVKYGIKKAKFYSIFLALAARLYYIKYNRILTKGGYNTICIWGGYAIAQKIAILIARKLGIRVFHFENGLLPNTTVMDYKGTNFFNSVPRSRSFYDNIQNTFKQTSLVVRGSVKPAKESIILPKKYIFCPFQVALDTQVLMNSPWVFDMVQFYHIIERMVKNTEEDLIFVIKEHPSCGKEYANLHNLNNPRIVFANSNNTEDLIKNSEMIITINSTVGIEAMIFEKKVITLGNAFYSGYGFAKHANNEEELLNAIKTRNDWKLDTEGTLKFLSYLQSQYLIEGSWRAPNQEHLKGVLEKFLQG